MHRVYQRLPEPLPVVKKPVGELLELDAGGGHDLLLLLRVVESSVAYISIGRQSTVVIVGGNLGAVGVMVASHARKLGTKRALK